MRSKPAGGPLVGDYHVDRAVPLLSSGQKFIFYRHRSDHEGLRVRLSTPNERPNVPIVEPAPRMTTFIERCLSKTRTF
jgi:hypothetical protein